MQSSRWLVIDNAEAYHAHNEGLASSTLFGSDASQFSTGATLTQVDLGGGGLQRCRDKGPRSGREGALCLSSSFSSRPWQFPSMRFTSYLTPLPGPV